MSEAPLTELDLDSIDVSLDLITPGPWHWSGNKNSYSGPYLATWIPGMGRCTVMDFTRLGMRSAQPRFRDNDRNLMIPSMDLAIPEVSYRDDIARIDHPDAEFIANVPDLMRRLVDVARESFR